MILWQDRVQMATQEVLAVFLCIQLAFGVALLAGVHQLL